MIRRPKQTSMRTSLTRRFIWNTRSFCLIFQTLIYPVHLALEIRLLYVRYPKVVPVCSFKNSTPHMHAIDTSVPRFTTVFQGTCTVVTLDFISKVLHVPRVTHPNYPSHPRLHNIPLYELASLFCEKAMVWGDTLNFSTIDFAKSPRILNMVMTFVLTP